MKFLKFNPQFKIKNNKIWKQNIQKLNNKKKIKHKIYNNNNYKIK